MRSVSLNLKPYRLLYLDALRGLAILGVLSVHCALRIGKPFTGSNYAMAGSYGVQLFFLISAFTIFMTLERSWLTECNVIIGFYVRRLFRILPMFWIGMVIYSLFPDAEYRSEDSDASPINYILTAVLQHGWNPASINNIVPGGWSIAVEVAFYTVAPLVFHSVSNLRHSLIFLLLSLILFAFANICLKVLIANHILFTGMQLSSINFFAIHWFPTQLPVFAFGITTFFIVKDIPVHLRKTNYGVTASCCSIALLFIVLDHNYSYLIVQRLLVSCAFSLLMLGLSIYPTGFIVNHAFCALGRISYSFYLLHFFVLNVIFKIAKKVFPEFISIPLPGFLTLFALTLLFTAFISYPTVRFVELPFTRLAHNLLSHKPMALQRFVKDKTQ